MTHLIGLCLLVGLQTAAGLRSPSEFRVIDQVKGEDSNVSEPKVIRVSDLQQWYQVWGVHSRAIETGANGGAGGVQKYSSPAPKVDFAKSEVIAIFGGLTDGAQGYDVLAVSSTPSRARIQIRPSPPLPGFNATSSSPYTFLMVPKSNKRIVVEQLVSPNMNGRARWRQIADLPPTE